MPPSPFTVRRVPFGRKPADPDDPDAEGLPTPARVKLLARRAAGIKEARDILADLPGPGESLHAVTSSRMDLSDVLNVLLERAGRCEKMVLATLGFGERNLKQMLAWLDSGAVGRLTLLASIFFKSHETELWQRTLAEFRARKQRAACGPSHAKVCTLAFATGERFALEGSANVRASGSVIEQVAIIHHAGLHDFHSGWIEARVTRHEGAADE